MMRGFFCVTSSNIALQTTSLMRFCIAMQMRPFSDLRTRWQMITVLHLTIVNYTAPHYIVLYSTSLQSSVEHLNTVCCVAPHYSQLHGTSLLYAVLNLTLVCCTAPHYSQMLSRSQQPAIQNLPTVCFTEL